MSNKRTIAMLIAASFAAGQAAAHSYSSDASGTSERQGMSPIEMVLSEDSFPRHLTVFNPDGTSYSLVAEEYALEFEPALIVMSGEPLPDQLTVFDPDGSVTSYRFTPIEVALMPASSGAVALSGESAASDATVPVIRVEIAEPIVVALADDAGIGPIVWFDEEGAPWLIPDQVIAFDASQAYAG